MLKIHKQSKRGNRESIWKRIQNNDSKDPKSRKHNEVTDKQTREKDQEDTRNV